MNVGRLDEAQELFEQARELPAEDQNAFLDRACDGDPVLRAMLHRLMTAHRSAGAFFAEPTVAPDAATPSATGADEQPPDRIGPYKVLERIGEGGFGTVWMAEQVEPIRRKVAIKIIRAGMGSKQVLARFEAERQALAMMEHPNIARVLDAGATEQGCPYVVMELVRGTPITEFCDAATLTIRQRLELFMDVCHAVQHAHTKGIIHRDIKPTNVLVTMHDDKPVPKVIDFGIAKAIHQPLTDMTQFTEFRQLIGTPEYMSPEQAQLGGIDIDTRSDVYSLGVLLYELLTGVTPFDRQKLRESSLDELRRIICEAEPANPSKRVNDYSDSRARTRRRSEPPVPASEFSQPEPCASGSGSSPAHPRGSDWSSDRPSSAIDIAQYRQTDPPSLRRRLHGDLDWIVMMCLEKDRARRYETASALADDIRRHLNGEPVVAAPPSRLYCLRKLLRRNRGAVAASLAFVLLLTGGAVVSTVLWQRAEQHRATAEGRRVEVTTAHLAEAKQRKQAEAMLALLTDLLTAADPHEVKGRNYSVRELLDDFALRTLDELRDEPELEINIRTTLGVTYQRLGELDKAEEHLSWALQTAERNWGPEHVLVTHPLFHWASLLHDRGQYLKAEQLVRRALEIGRSVPGNERHVLQWLPLLGDLCAHLGRAEESLGVALKTLELQRQESGEKHLAVAGRLADVGSCMKDLHRYADAERYIREALELQIELHGAQKPAFSATLNALANLLSETGRYQEAEEAHRKALVLDRELFGDDHPRVAERLETLSVTLWRQDKFAKAEELLRQALIINRRVFGPDHPAIAANLHNLASQLQGQWRFREAESLYSEALAMRRRLHGDKHPLVANTLNSLATLLWREGKPAEAVPLLEEALSINRAMLGNKHPDVATNLFNLASQYETLGDLEQAETRYRESLAIDSDIRGPDHPLMVGAWNKLGLVLQRKRDFEGAYGAFSTALTIARKRYVESHWWTAVAKAQVASALRGLGRLAEAEALARESMGVFRGLPAANAEAHGRALVVLAEVLADAQKRGQALQAIEDGVVELRTAHGPEHPANAMTLHRLAGPLLQLGELARAEELVREAIGIYSAKPNENVREHTLAMIRLVDILVRTDRLGEAKNAASEFVELRRQMLPEDDGELAPALSTLGWVLIKEGKYAEAETLLRDSLRIRNEKLPPKQWPRFDTMSMLGEAILGQAAELIGGPGEKVAEPQGDETIAYAAGDEPLQPPSRPQSENSFADASARLAEAEPLLLDGFDGLRNAPDVPDNPDRKREALERIIKLYETWHAAEPDKGFDAKAVEWRAKLGL